MHQMCEICAYLEKGTGFLLRTYIVMTPAENMKVFVVLMNCRSIETALKASETGSLLLQVRLAEVLFKSHSITTPCLLFVFSPSSDWFL
jgi:hypothetical protein